MTRYRFSCGDTTTGEAGFCFTVTAPNRPAAIRMAQIVVDGGNNCPCDADCEVGPGESVVLTFYVGKFTMTDAHIADCDRETYTERRKEAR